MCGAVRFGHNLEATLDALSLASILEKSIRDRTSFHALGMQWYETIFKRVWMSGCDAYIGLLGWCPWGAPVAHALPAPLHFSKNYSTISIPVGVCDVRWSHALTVVLCFAKERVAGLGSSTSPLVGCCCPVALYWGDDLFMTLIYSET